MKATLTKSPKKQAGKRRKRKRREGSVSTTGKAGAGVGARAAVGLSQVPVLKGTDLPEASETVKGRQRN